MRRLLITTIILLSFSNVSSNSGESFFPQLGDNELYIYTLENLEHTVYLEDEEEVHNFYAIDETFFLFMGSAEMQNHEYQDIENTIYANDIGDLPLPVIIIPPSASLSNKLFFSASVVAKNNKWSYNRVIINKVIINEKKDNNYTYAWKVS